MFGESGAAAGGFGVILARQARRGKVAALLFGRVG